MKLLHCSPVPNLDTLGLIPNSKPSTARARMSHIYLGTWNYLCSDFFHYCKPGRYYLYEVSTVGLPLDDSCPGEQYRTSTPVCPSRITLKASLSLNGKGKYKYV